MATQVIMPRQGQSVESCIISQWFKSPGDNVQKGDILFAYETDKASFEAEAETEGILLNRLFEAGDEVPVLKVVAYIGNKGELARDLFAKLQGTSENPETCILQMDLMESRNNLPVNIKLIGCTLEQMTENCKVITKETFKIFTLDSGWSQ